MSEKIEIVWGSSEGDTKLGSFDKALEKAGVHNYNLSELSSVIPPEFELKNKGVHNRVWDVGSVVACVISANTSSKRGEKVCSGIGWSISEQGGILYEA
jgi:arginine decarboxylase